MCNRSKERHSTRQVRQRLGHAVAASQVKQRRIMRQQMRRLSSEGSSQTTAVGTGDAAPVDDNNAVPTVPAAAGAALAGATAAATSSQPAPSTFPVQILRVGKNSTGKALTCSHCKSQIQLVMYSDEPASLYIVLRHSQHSNADGIVCHGPSSGERPVSVTFPSTTGACTRQTSLLPTPQGAQ